VQIERRVVYAVDTEECSNRMYMTLRG
jgi:hypothetical protein